MKFKFSLEPVLKVRQHQEKVQQQKLAEEMTNKNKITTLRAEVKGKLENYLENQQGDKVANIHTIKRHNAHLVHVNDHINRLKQEENKASEKVQEERGKLAEAFKKLSILEKVKENEQGVFVKELAKSDQKFMDEISSQSFSR
ncbi:MAG: flagellar export protein FliJ [Balneolaceae bacterium]|jgi:flagellar export protein FliJ|nr:flagellar export protein FliJ [Balneolaceae bacterium]